MRYFAEAAHVLVGHHVGHEPHLYIHQDEKTEKAEPGLAAWFGNEFNRKNTWFEHMDVFSRYLKRCNHMLQQGRYIADIAYFIGEDAPKMTGVCSLRSRTRRLFRRFGLRTSETLMGIPSGRSFRAMS